MVNDGGINISKKKSMRLNDAIKGVDEVRMIDEDGEMVGVVPLAKALEIAASSELDLCEISPNANPPVCRVMDYGKYLYQQKKKEHDNQKKAQGHEMKQIRIKSFRIDEHDVNIKLKATRKFIESEHRVLLTLMFRARENDHPELGRELLVEKFAKPLEDVAVVVANPRKEGRRMTMTLAPVVNLAKILKQRKDQEAKMAKLQDKNNEAEQL